MEMKTISIPEELHAWLYANTTAERKSMYSVIEWLKERAIQNEYYVSNERL